MRFNSMNKDNDRKKSYFEYMLIAVGVAIAVYFILKFSAFILVLLGKVIVKYWWGAVILVLIILLIKFKKKKK